LVIDTAPLQALHRADALRVLERAYGEVWVPRAVHFETQRSLVGKSGGPRRVPDLDAHAWIRIGEVDDDEIARAGATLARARRSTHEYHWLGRKIDRPALEAILLAKRLSSPVVMEEARGVDCAREVGVATLCTADVLVALEDAALFDDADARAKAVIATGYDNRELEWLSRRAYPWRPR
jgi:predicted nucleic acid-binding protein